MDDNYHLIDDNCPFLKKVITPLVLNVAKVLQRSSITRDPHQKNVSTKPKFWWKSIISASLPIYLKKEYSLKPCSGPLVKIIILLSLCTARSLNTLALNIPSGFSTASRMHECPRDQPNCMRVKKLFLRVFFLGLRAEQY